VPPEAPAEGAAAATAAVPARRTRLARLRERADGSVLAAVLVVLVALVAAWSAYQPVRAVHASDAAFDRLDAGAPAAAADIARIGSQRNPLSVDPLFDLAAIEQARGRTREAQLALERAVRLQPANAATWSRLGRLRLSVLNDPRGALRAFRAAYFLDPRSPQTVSDVLEASRAAAG
jgi:cytochrome c-type biogenesis protein CcmH/NrfG